MIGQALRQLQEALNRKADAVQREFIGVGEALQALSRQISDAHSAEEAAPFLSEQASLRERQQALAAEANVWRDRARAVLRQPSEAALQAFLGELAASGEEPAREAAERARYLLSLPEDELNRLEQTEVRARATTPAGRLLERARTEFDLRGAEPAPRQRAAVEFANRPGLAQEDEPLAELEAALGDKDAMVHDVAIQTVIQIYRFRAMRLGDLDAAHAAVERLARYKHPSAIPALVEILETPRTGFAKGEGGMVEATNRRSRAMALSCLARWHTPEAQSALRARLHDRDPYIAQASKQILDADPGTWRG